MTPLRQKMVDAMQQRGLSVRTHVAYLSAVRRLAKYYHTSPDEIQPDQIQEYFVYLVKERGLSDASCRLYLNALRFLYLQVLEWDHFDVPIHYPKKTQKIPELLTRREVKQILSACSNDKHRMMLTLCYGCGLRVSELVAIKVRHIDGERHLLRVEQGKGAKDRGCCVSNTAMSPARLLDDVSALSLAFSQCQQAGSTPDACIANRCKETSLEVLRKVLGQPAKATDGQKREKRNDYLCPKCRKGHLVAIRLLNPTWQHFLISTVRTL